MQQVTQDDKIYSNHYESIRTEATKISYNKGLRAFMKFLGIWINSDRHKKEKEFHIQKFSKLIEMSKDQAFEEIKSFLKGSKSTWVFDQYYQALRHFYEMNDRDDINWKKLKKFRGAQSEANEDRAYTKEEIHKLFSIAHPRLKATILLCSSAGLHIEALSSLSRSHLIEKRDCYLVKVYRGTKGNGKYYTFCSPEARKAIEEYFKFREQYGEKINPESPVFRKVFNTEIPYGARQNVKRIVTNTLNRDIWEHLKQAGIRQVDHTTDFRTNRKSVKLSHGFRKFFETQLVNANIHETIIRKLTGHSDRANLTQLYSKQTEDELFAEYDKAIPYLTIDQTSILNEKVEKQKVQLNEVEVLKIEYNNNLNLVLQDNNKLRQEAEEHKRRLAGIEQNIPEIDSQVNQLDQKIKRLEESIMSRIKKTKQKTQTNS